MMKLWLNTACRADVVARSRRVALLVGTILVLINYFDRIADNSLLTTDYIKMFMTYCVPYCVSTYASVGAILEQRRGDKNEKV